MQNPYFYEFWYETVYYLKWYDLFLVPVYILVINNIIKKYEKNKISSYPYYKYFTKGLMFKITGCLLLFIVFNFYYGYGDTFGYYRTNECLTKLFLKNPINFFKVWLGPNSVENYALFDTDTLFPPYWGDPQVFMIVRITAPLTILGFNSYLLTSLLLVCFSFSGIWKLYLLFISYFPGAYEKVSFACFFIPSVVFWGSGLLKDSITLSLIGWYCFSFNQCIIRRNSIVNYSIIFLISSYFILSIKPYIFACLIPTTAIWVAFAYYTKISNKFYRFLLIPIISIFCVMGVFWLFDALSKELQQFALDKVLTHALTVQNDLKQDYYEGTAFDIGDFEPTISGALSKFPKAITATFFRPFLWEIKSPVVFFSAVESFFILIFSLKVFYEIGFFSFFKYILKSPITAFTFSFSIIFGFSVGLTSANFGSLVRYKIPCLVFYLVTLILVKFMHSQKDNRTEVL
ncbi:MAG: hypothetical protein A3G23_04045 [Bacteroidetes bacterium RIFCSPLOWO2_12_FULL_37_12]|nr:MAG: hypothetical protein A3G23_04045 [Bacteroidetes bacterium RIFCSPLOWO2_12_FULL_37_12]